MNKKQQWLYAFAFMFLMTVFVFSVYNLVTVSNNKDTSQQQCYNPETCQKIIFVEWRNEQADQK
jgi:hypothetical protein